MGERRHPFSLAARLTTWYAASAFALVLTATGFLYWNLAANLDRETDEILADQIHILRTILRDRPEDTAALEQEVEWEWTARRHAPIYVRILDERGRTVMEAPGMNEILPPGYFTSSVPVEADPGPGETVVSATGVPYRILAAKSLVEIPGRPVRTLQVALDRSREETLLAGYRRTLGLILGLALLACAAGGYGIARRGIRPVREITATARRIRSSTLSDRLEVIGLPAELAELAVTFNDMLDRLEESFARLSRFSSDLAHELRTPLNNLRGEVEVTLGRPRSPGEYRDTLGSCLEEFARLSGIIDGLLFLARSENLTTEVPREPLDLGHELEAVREFYEPVASEVGVRLTLDSPEAVLAPLNRALFQRALGNLVENALTHTPPDGNIAISLSRSAESLRIEVTDTGCGISGHHLPHITERFYRVDPSRDASHGGVGLGLAIVQSIAALHGGSLEITSELGEGTQVVLVFPISQRT